MSNQFIYYGDIPVEHLEVVRELVDLEIWFSANGQEIQPSLAAKGFVSMAHDYYSMYMDEEGERLLNRANNCMPGYFKGLIHQHAKSDGVFDTILHNLTYSPAVKLMKSFGFVA